jgi:hypothetical protein
MNLWSFAILNVKLRALMCRQHLVPKSTKHCLTVVQFPLMISVQQLWPLVSYTRPFLLRAQEKNGVLSGLVELDFVSSHRPVSSSWVWKEVVFYQTFNDLAVQMRIKLLIFRFQKFSWSRMRLAQFVQCTGVDKGKSHSSQSPYGQPVCAWAFQALWSWIQNWTVLEIFRRSTLSFT